MHCYLFIHFISYLLYGYCDNNLSRTILIFSSSQWSKPRNWKLEVGKEEHMLSSAHSHRRAWRGNPFWRWCKETSTLKILPSSPWDGPSTWWDGSRGHTLCPLGHMMLSSMTTSKVRESKLHPCVWFIHYKASIIQALALLHTQKCIYIKSSFIISEQNNLCRKFHIAAWQH